jgi:hypothetical protein
MPLLNMKSLCFFFRSGSATSAKSRIVIHRYTALSTRFHNCDSFELSLIVHVVQDSCTSELGFPQNLQ